MNNTAAETIMRAGFGDYLESDERSLFFLVRTDDLEHAARLLRVIDLDDEADQVAKISPDAVQCVEVGREYSPVVYVHMALGSTDVDAVRVRAALAEAQPDELHTIGTGGETKIRAWWD